MLKNTVHVAGKQYIQNSISNYKSPSSYSEALHMLLHTEGLRLPKSVRVTLEKFFANPKYAKQTLGSTYMTLERIAEIVGYSLKTMKAVFKYLKENGLVITLRTATSEGHRGSDYKVLAGIETVKAFIQKWLPNRLPSGSLRSNDERPCESKDEQPKKSEHSNTYIKKPILNSSNINKRKKNKKKNVTSKFQYLNKHVKRLALTWKSDEFTQFKVGEKIQFALNYFGYDIESDKTQKAVYNALHFTKLEMKNDNIKTDLLGCLFNALKNQFQWFGETTRKTPVNKPYLFDMLENGNDQETPADNSDLPPYDQEEGCLITLPNGQVIRTDF